MIDGNNLVYELDSCSKPLYEKAKARKVLYQYTNFDSLLHIVMDKTLLFNRIDKMNDLQEAELFKNEEVAKLVYLSCFSVDDEESIPMWNIYTRKNDGLRMKFEVEDGNLFETIIDNRYPIKTLNGRSIGRVGHSNGKYDINDWLADFIQTDIYYTSVEKLDDTFIREGMAYKLNKMALAKDVAWDYEQESRVVLKLRTTKKEVEEPSIPGFLVPIDLSKLKCFEITFGPWMEEVKKECIRDMKNKYLGGVNVSFGDSSFTKKIQRKE